MTSFEDCRRLKRFADVSLVFHSIDGQHTALFATYRILLCRASAMFARRLCFGEGVSIDSSSYDGEGDPTSPSTPLIRVRDVDPRAFKKDDGERGICAIDAYMAHVVYGEPLPDDIQVHDVAHVLQLATMTLAPENVVKDLTIRVWMAGVAIAKNPDPNLMRHTSRNGMMSEEAKKGRKRARETEETMLRAEWLSVMCDMCEGTDLGSALKFVKDHNIKRDPTNCLVRAISFNDYIGMFTLAVRNGHLGACNIILKIVESLKLKQDVRGSFNRIIPKEIVKYASTPGHIAMVRHMIRDPAFFKASCDDKTDYRFNLMDLHQASQHGNIECAIETMVCARETWSESDDKGSRVKFNTYVLGYSNNVATFDAIKRHLASVQDVASIDVALLWKIMATNYSSMWNDSKGCETRKSVSERKCLIERLFNDPDYQLTDAKTQKDVIATSFVSFVKFESLNQEYDLHGFLERVERMGWSFPDFEELLKDSGIPRDEKGKIPMKLIDAMRRALMRIKDRIPEDALERCMRKKWVDAAIVAFEAIAYAPEPEKGAFAHVRINVDNLLRILLDTHIHTSASNTNITRMCLNDQGMFWMQTLDKYDLISRSTLQISVEVIERFAHLMLSVLWGDYIHQDQGEGQDLRRSLLGRLISTHFQGILPDEVGKDAVTVWACLSVPNTYVSLTKLLCHYQWVHPNTV